MAPPVNTPAGKQVQKWLSRIEASLQREDKYRKKAKKLLELYEADKVSENSFNILYANTETMRPAVLSATPRPRVRQRWVDQDPIANTAAQATERLLTFLSDTGNASQSPFAGLLKEAVRQALVPGRGLAIFQYEPTLEEGYAGSAPQGEGAQPDAAATPTPDTVKSSDDVDDSEAVQDATPSNTVAAATPPDLATETICGYPISYDRVVFGYAKTWDDIPWIAIEYPMTKEDLARQFGDTIANDIPLNQRKSPPSKTGDDEDDEAGKPNTAQVYAVWHKEKREVIFLCSGYPDRVLKQVPDPLGLSGFYPIPEQLVFFMKSESLLPVPLYKFYEQQAQELNRVSARINKLISVMKARGMYDKTLANLAALNDKDDGQFVPLENVPTLGQNPNLDNAIWIWPIEKFISVLQALYLQREQVKQVIYEISGLSDIIRGSTVASETATAQKIKNQWGTLRLQDSQNLVGAFARNCFRIMAEIAINHFQPATWARMTGMKLPMLADKQAAQQQLAALQQQGQALMSQIQQAQAAAPPPQGPPQGPPGPPQPGQQPVPGQPPGQPAQAPPDPQVQQMMQQAQGMQQQAQQLEGIVSQPAWEEVLQALKENVKDNFLIDIQTNSTLDATISEDKADLSALVGAISQMLQALGPMVQSGALPMTIVKALLMGILQSYRFGDDIMEMVRGLPDQAPSQGKPDPKVKAIQQKAALEQQTAQNQLEFQQQSNSMQLQQKQAELALTQKKIDQESQAADQEHSIRMQEMVDKASDRQQQRAMQRESLHGKDAAAESPDGDECSSWRQRCQYMTSSARRVISSRALRRLATTKLNARAVIASGRRCGLVSLFPLCVETITPTTARSQASGLRARRRTKTT